MFITLYFKYPFNNPFSTNISVTSLIKPNSNPDLSEIANKVFSINKYEIERAMHIKEVFEASAAKGINGFMDDKYGFIDEPIYRDVLLVLSTKKKQGLE